MIDKSLKAGATFDWITPLWALIQNFWNRPAVGFTVPMDAGCSTHEIAQVLKEAGIKSWGMMLIGDDILFSTRRAQARYAEFVLNKNGISSYNNSARPSALGRISNFMFD